VCVNEWECVYLCIRVGHTFHSRRGVCVCVVCERERETEREKRENGKEIVRERRGKRKGESVYVCQWVGACVLMHTCGTYISLHTRDAYISLHTCDAHVSL